MRADIIFNNTCTETHPHTNDPDPHTNDPAGELFRFNNTSAQKVSGYQILSAIFFNMQGGNESSMEAHFEQQISRGIKGSSK